MNVCPESVSEQTEQRTKVRSERKQHGLQAIRRILEAGAVLGIDLPHGRLHLAQTLLIARAEEQVVATIRCSAEHLERADVLRVMLEGGYKEVVKDVLLRLESLDLAGCLPPVIAIQARELRPLDQRPGAEATYGLPARRGRQLLLPTLRVLDGVRRLVRAYEVGDLERPGRERY